MVGDDEENSHLVCLESARTPHTWHATVDEIKAGRQSTEGYACSSRLIGGGV
jgi:hypothetical protein